MIYSILQTQEASQKTATAVARRRSAGAVPSAWTPSKAGSKRLCRQLGRKDIPNPMQRRSQLGLHAGLFCVRVALCGVPARDRSHAGRWAPVGASAPRCSRARDVAPPGGVRRPLSATARHRHAPSRSAWRKTWSRAEHAGRQSHSPNQVWEVVVVLTRRLPPCFPPLHRVPALGLDPLGKRAARSARELEPEGTCALGSKLRSISLIRILHWVCCPPEYGGRLGGSALLCKTQLSFRRVEPPSEPPRHCRVRLLLKRGRQRTSRTTNAAAGSGSVCTLLVESALSNSAPRAASSLRSGRFAHEHRQPWRARTEADMHSGTSVSMVEPHLAGYEPAFRCELGGSTSLSCPLGMEHEQHPTRDGSGVEPNYNSSAPNLPTGLRRRMRSHLDRHVRSGFCVTFCVRVLQMFSAGPFHRVCNLRPTD